MSSDENGSCTFFHAGIDMQTVAKKKNPSAFAARLRALREAVPLTQKQVAEGVGVSIQTYMRWERGDTEPTFSELCVIAEMCKKTPNDFIPDE